MGEPGTAARTGRITVAGESHLVFTQPSDLVDAGDRLAGTGGIAGHPDDVAEALVDAEEVGAQDVLDVPPALLVENREPNIKIRIRGVRPPRVDELGLDLPDPVRGGAVAVTGDEDETAEVGPTPPGVHTVSGRDDEITSRTVDGAGRTEVVALGVVREQRPDPLPKTGRLRGRRTSGGVSTEEALPTPGRALARGPRQPTPGTAPRERADQRHRHHDPAHRDPLCAFLPV